MRRLSAGSDRAARNAASGGSQAYTARPLAHGVRLLPNTSCKPITSGGNSASTSSTTCARCSGGCNNRATASHSTGSASHCVARVPQPCSIELPPVRKASTSRARASHCSTGAGAVVALRAWPWWPAEGMEFMGGTGRKRNRPRG